MSRKTLVAPSLLAADFSRMGEEAKAVEAAGADLLHLDVMDGRFVPNITFGGEVVRAMKRSTALPLDVHLMIVEPEKHIDDFARAGASRISVHAEVCPHLHRVLQQIAAHGVMPAVALNPSTSLCMVEEVLGDVGMVLVMSVNPGFGGQKFIPGALDKVRRLRAMADQRGLDLDIQVDGGVNDRNAKALAEAGANVLVAGSYVFGKPDYAQAIASLR